MKFTIKNLKHSEWASEETNCFSATLYADGKPVCHVSNDGRGGSDHYSPMPKAESNGLKFWERIAELEAEAAKTTYTCPYFGEETPHSLETIVGELVEAELLRRSMKSALGKAALFTIPGEKGVYQVKYKGRKKPDAALFKHVREKNPGATVLNELPEAEALAVFRGVAA